MDGMCRALLPCLPQWSFTDAEAEDDNSVRPGVSTVVHRAGEARAPQAQSFSLLQSAKVLFSCVRAVTVSQVHGGSSRGEQRPVLNMQDFTPEELLPNMLPGFGWVLFLGRHGRRSLSNGHLPEARS